MIIQDKDYNFRAQMQEIDLLCQLGQYGHDLYLSE